MAATNSSSETYDVAICGTGPAGMLTALYAAQKGLKAVLVGPDINTADRRTTALLAPSLDKLSALRLGEAVADIGTPLMTMRLIDGSQRLLRAPTVSFGAEEIGRLHFGLNCPNKHLNAILLQAVEAQDSLTRRVGTVVSYDLNGDTPRLTLSDGTILSALSVIAADGKNSPAREAAGIAVRRWSYPQVAAVGMVTHQKHHDYISTEFHTETGPFTFVPMPDDVSGSPCSSFVCALGADEADKLAALDLDEAGLFLQKRSLHLLGKLELSEPVQLWPLEALVADVFAAKGVYLVGEAAHTFPPIGAQGLNLSIRDGHDAVDVITNGIGATEDLTGRVLAARYTSKRRADIWTRTFGVDALNRSLLSNNPLLQVGRKVALGAAKVSPLFKRGLMVAGLEQIGMRPLISILKRDDSEAAKQPLPLTGWTSKGTSRAG